MSNRNDKRSDCPAFHARACALLLPESTTLRTKEARHDQDTFVSTSHLTHSSGRDPPVLSLSHSGNERWWENCFASVEMGQTACSNKVQFRAEVDPCPRKPGSDSHLRKRWPFFDFTSWNDTPVSDLCDQHGIRPTMFYRWQKEFFENAAAAFEPRSRRAGDGKDRRIAFLEDINPATNLIRDSKDLVVSGGIPIVYSARSGLAQIGGN